MTTAQDQQSRAKFEAWARRACYEVRRHDSGQYARNTTEQVWQAWQAARALPAGMEPVGYMIDWPDEPELGHYFAEKANDGARSQALHTAAQVQAMGRVPPGWQVTEEMHIAAVKVLHRASGVDGLPQRMVDAMLAAAPRPPAAQEPAPLTDERIRQLDDATKFHESPNWSLRFARAVEADHGIKEPTNG